MTRTNKNLSSWAFLLLCLYFQHPLPLFGYQGGRCLLVDYLSYRSRPVVSFPWDIAVVPLFWLCLILHTQCPCLGRSIDGPFRERCWLRDLSACLSNPFYTIGYSITVT
ncbi:hypothetical protein F4678DRAFT_179274 [Xylaria arbuscula]|nr:hypothetical protein F4678DRAFT_179274 [Xylaria arbuscula]